MYSYIAIPGLCIYIQDDDDPDNESDEVYNCRRRIPESGKEFYVCFQDTVPQS